MNEFFIKRTDKLPVLQSELTDYYGAIDLTNIVSSSFVYKSRYGGTPTTGAGLVISATSGIVQYAWSTNDVANPGVYYGEWRIVFSGGKQMTFPNDGFITFEIGNNIDTY